MSSTYYYLDFSTFSLDTLKVRIETTRLPPSHAMLREKIDERFELLARIGIENLEQLQRELKSKSDVHSFADETGLPLDYLTVLRREVNSYQPKPVKLRDFPGVAPDAVTKLEQIGIRNTKQLFPRVLTPQDRQRLALETQVEDDVILELTKLTDVARLKWVGPKFARLLVESDYDTVESIANSDYESLYQDLMQINESTGIYKGSLGIDDLKDWVNVVVQDIPQVIQY
jgi:hypothetical protein